MKSKDISKTKNKSLTLSDTEQNTILEDLINGKTAYEIAKQKQISLRTLYSALDQNPKFKEEFNKAQEIGIKTLVEKMMVIFDTDNPNIEPNELLFIREKKDWLKFISPRLSSFFQEKQNLNVKSDSTMRIKWDDGSDIKEIEGIVDEIEQQPPKD